VIYVDFLPHSIAINVQYCSNLFLSEVHQVMWKKRPVKLSNKIIILCGNAVHTQQNWWRLQWQQWARKSLTTPPYSPDLASMIFICLDHWKCTQEDGNFKHDELKHGVLNWFNAAGISNLPGQWKKCISVKAEYLQMAWEFGMAHIFILLKNSRSALNHPHTQYLILLYTYSNHTLNYFNHTNINYFSVSH
jgi:hypothetical protein